MKIPLSLRHPILYYLRVQQRRLFRHFSWRFSKRIYARHFHPEPLKYRYIKHTSKLIRTLGNSDLLWQHNKVTNLKIATDCINNIIIAPHQHFSFCLLVGKPTKKRGFVEGMELSFGEARGGIGGGICQLSNLIHWMALHSPLIVVERANHSFDPFPDKGRVLPFGSGAAIFYNFVDLVLYNPTDNQFQLCFEFTDTQLEGELRCNQQSDIKYHVYQKNHKFEKINNRVYRMNEIWRDIKTKGHHTEILESKCLYANQVIVKYELVELSDKPIC